MSQRLSEEDERHFDELADKAERGEFVVRGEQLRGEDAAEAGRKMILEATGMENLDEAMRVIRGRPRIGEPSGPETATWKVVAPGALDQAVAKARKARNMNKSQYIRFAVVEQIKADALAQEEGR